MKTMKLDLAEDDTGRSHIRHGRWVPESEWRKIQAVIRTARKFDDEDLPYILVQALRKLDGKKGN